MAEWTNLFDLGECTVSVQMGGDTPFEQVMAKGESASFVYGVAELEYTVAVDEAGSVSISADYRSEVTALLVSPNFSMDHAGERVSGVTLNDGAFAYAWAGNDEDVVDFEQLSPASPDPAVLTDLEGDHDFLAILLTGGG